MGQIIPTYAKKIDGSIKYRLIISCPYCKTKSIAWVGHIEPEVIYCDIEEGGCDKPIAVDIKEVAARFNVYILVESSSAGQQGQQG